MRRALLGAGAAAGVLLAALVVLFWINVVTGLETEVPSRGEIPDLPDGLRVGEVNEGCGSGSCYLEFTVEGAPGDTPAAILARLPPQEQCGRRSPVDWRPRCIGYAEYPDGVRGAVSIRKWLG